MYNISFTNGSMLCIYLIDNQFVCHKLWCLFCINHNDEKRMNKIFRYNGGFNDIYINIYYCTCLSYYYFIDMLKSMTMTPVYPPWFEVSYRT